MKICLINNLFTPYNRGGAEQVVAAMANNFMNTGHEVFIISTRPKNNNRQAPSNFRLIYINSNFYNLNELSLLKRFFWQVSNILAIKKFFKLKKILNKEKPDLVISHNLMGIGFLAVRAIKKNKLKHYHFLHDIQLLHPSGLMFFGHENIIDSKAAKIYQYITHYLFDSPSKIISPSTWLLNEHLKRGFFNNSEIEIKRLSAIFKNQEITPEPSRQKNGPTKKLIFAGQIEEHKGIIFLIQAFIDKAENDLELKIAGDGQLLTKAKDLAKNDKRIKFLGKLNKQELFSELLKADALIMPSLCYENSPAIILEAQQAGLKVIASNIGGIPEILKKTDQAFIPADANDLFRKINL